jgi:ABC-2 type transport system ATP-binding protein
MANEQRDFWSKVAPKYDRVVDLQFGGARTRSMVQERIAKEGRLGNLAEFGCGTGYCTRVLAEKADHVVATDLSPGMLTLAKDHVKALNVTFQVEDCQKTSFPDEAFDAAFMGLVIHLIEPDKALAEMRRILRRGGTLIIANVGLGALTGLDRIRAFVRILYRGITGFRVKPPKGFAKHMLTEKQLCDRLRQFGFEKISAETIKDATRSSNIPIQYIRAVKV